MGLSRQEYWRELPCPSPGDLADPGIEPVSLMSPALAGGFFTTSTTWEAQTVNLGYSRQLSVGVKTWPFLTWFFSLEAETSPLTGSGSPPVHLLLHLLHRLPGASVFWLHRGRSHCLYKVPKSRELPDIGGAERAR